MTEHDIFTKDLCKDCKYRNASCITYAGRRKGDRIITCGNYKKEPTPGKGMEVLGTVMKAFGEGLAIGMKAAEEAARDQEPDIQLKTDVTLGVAELQQLSGMSSFQLERLFKGKTVHLADDPMVYRELQKFSSFQMGAIFGKDEEKKD